MSSDKEMIIPLTRAMKVEPLCDSQKELKDAYERGYSAGYAARDKLCLSGCGDGGKEVEPNVD